MGPCYEIQAFRCRPFGGKMASRFHRSTAAGVETFDGLSGVNHLRNLHVVVEEGNELFHALSRRLMIEGYLVPHLSLNDSIASCAAFGFGAA